ncbi:hypothetical protein Ahy_B05g077933 [Arachis hypogaea]|uniref:Zinc finger GRF-type domain-containing protein n=1 Tax=Arachis hypogaea TaxID=3818 RepID=A0A444Z5W9_ARAHY|nr:hypothetical protein Ahy_B05g077933 [Arachis hypogaea]
MHGWVSEWCDCGSRPVLKWSGIEMHPNKLVFGCPNYNSSALTPCELFIWANSVHDEVPIKADEENEKDEMKMNFS